MRKVTLAAAFVAAGLALGAQGQAVAPQAPGSAAMDAVRQAAATDKKGLVEKNMQLTPEEAQKFWPLYEEYQKNLGRIMQRQNRAVLDYVKSESLMTDANAKRIAQEVLSADGEEQKLRERSFKQMLAALPARKAVRYMQIENKLRVFYRYDIAEQIPLVR